jgi:hypothetical protein
MANLFSHKNMQGHFSALWNQHRVTGEIWLVNRVTDHDKLIKFCRKQLLIVSQLSIYKVFSRKNGTCLSRLYFRPWCAWSCFKVSLSTYFTSQLFVFWGQQDKQKTIKQCFFIFVQQLELNYRKCAITGLIFKL